MYIQFNLKQIGDHTISKANVSSNSRIVYCLCRGIKNALTSMADSYLTKMMVWEIFKSPLLYFLVLYFLKIVWHFGWYILYLVWLIWKIVISEVYLLATFEIDLNKKIRAFGTPLALFSQKRFAHKNDKVNTNSSCSISTKTTK